MEVMCSSLPLALTTHTLSLVCVCDAERAEGLRVVRCLTVTQAHGARLFLALGAAEAELLAAHACLPAAVSIQAAAA